MKRIFKKNQIMITTLAIMIAVAGYLNFAGAKIGEADFISTDGSDSALSYEISDEDNMLAISLNDDGENTVSDYSKGDNVDIASLDTDDVTITENYLSGNMNVDDKVESVDSNAVDITASHGVLDDGEDKKVADASENDNFEMPGEAVFTSATGLTETGTMSLAGAKLIKEQTRAQNKQALQEIIDNDTLTESAKQEAVTSMIELTQMTQKEADAQMLLEAKGFSQTVVSLSDGYADVMIGAASLTDAQTAQIIDIVQRKTGVAPENIIITISDAE